VLKTKYKFPEPPIVAKIPVTQLFFDQQQEKLKELSNLRKEVMGRLIVAREMGDLSENGAYHAAKAELGNLGRQIRTAKHILVNAEIPPISKDSVAGFGKKITLKNEKKTLSFTLVSQHESDLVAKKYSMESPIGQAVLGKKINDKVEVISPRGKTSYLISAID